MHFPLALLYASLMMAPECTSLPTMDESIEKNIHSILNIVKMTLVHIKLKTKWQVLSQVEVNSPTIDGLTGVSNDLGLLDEELQSLSTEVLSQIQADISCLEGRVRSLALMMDCPIRNKPGAQAREHLFPISQHYEMLAKVQHYLENLHLNKDKLMVC
ncbi:leptin b [Nematolebias whitei]|uniref:leptin b n=1 Tax=Nematolebias whitei TaxID=451745 RepID=UPI00189A914A|nr:leptin b [Nematolebias whitei]